MKPIVLSSLALALLPLAAFAQGTPHPDDAPVVEVEIEEEVLEGEEGEEGVRGGIVIIEESSDGEGPATRSVIVLEGDDLEGLDLEGLDLDLDGMEKGVRRGKLKLDGGDGFEFEFDLDLDGEGGPVLDARLKDMLKKLEGRLGGEGKTGDFDPSKFMERVRGQARKSQESQRELRAKRERESLLAALELDAESASVVTPLLDAVLETKTRIERDDAARRRGLRASSGDEASMRQLLDTQRAANQDEARELAAARANLRELMTVKQELELVLRGVLD